MSDHDRIVILLTRRIAGELSPAEAEELRLALEQDPTLRELSAAIESVSDAPPKSITAKEEQQMLERGLRQWRQRTVDVPVMGLVTEEEKVYQLPTRSRGRQMIRWSAAAAIIILVALGGYLYKGKQHSQPAVITWREVVTKYGTRNYIELPDGSRLWLNAGSKVRYAEGFANGERALTLWGEAYFDIKHDPENPFLIHAGGLNVKVLGTSLNVKAYPGDSTVETTLIQGKAQIELPGRNSDPIVLKPSEKITMLNRDAGSDQIIREPGKQNTATGSDWEPHPNYQRHSVTADPTYKTIIETSWVEDKLVFRKEPFREVAAKLERWYNIRFHFENDKYLDEELTGYFKDQPIKNVMDALQVSLGCHYEIAGDSILIR